MEMELKKKGGIEAGVILVLAASLLFVCFLTGGNTEAFLVDDNRMQWYPVMERAYRELANTGRICCYDLYQMKGMPIAQQGYYGIMNPFMLLSYIAASLLPGQIPMISCYIGLMVMAGNLVCYLLCRRLGCGQGLAFLMTAAYSTLGCFWAFCYWYYIFNNYLMIPLLIYVFVRCKKGLISYCACGIVLAVSIYMGNVQYAFYQYVVFGILCIIMILLKERRYFKVLFINVVIGLGFSLPILLLALQASNNFRKYQDFFENPVFLNSLLVHSVIPQGILHRRDMGFSFMDSSVMYRKDNMVLYMGIIAIWLFVAMIWAVSRCVKHMGKCRNLVELWRECKTTYDHAAAWTHEQKTIAGLIAAVLFFLSVMSGGIAATLLHALPVVRNFRHLFKAVFVVAPLVIVIFAWAVGRQERNRIRFVTILLTAVFACIGCFNARDEVWGADRLYGLQIDRGFVGEKEDAIRMIEKASMDCKNYRTVTFLRFPWINDEVFNISENLSRNFPTAISIFSLAGYENAVNDCRMEAFDTIYTDKEFYTRFANADITKNLLQNLTQKPKKVAQQLMDNGVRYLLIDKSSLEDNQRAQAFMDAGLYRDLRPEIISALKELPDIRVVAVKEFNEHYDLVEIDGVNSLCMNSGGERIPLTDINMETVVFEAQEAGEYTLSFAYDSHLQAFLTEKDGTKHPLSIERAVNDNILISTQGGCGKVTLTYQDPVCIMGFVWEAVVSLAFVMLLAGMNSHCFHKTSRE